MKENSNILRSSWPWLMVQKKYNPSSCVAPRRKPTMAYGRITNFPSCVAWRPLCHLIMNYDRKCVKLKALFCNFTLPIYCCCKLKYCCLSHYQCCCSKYKFSLRPFLSISLYTKRELTSLNCILKFHTSNAVVPLTPSKNSNICWLHMYYIIQ